MDKINHIAHMVIDCEECKGKQMFDYPDKTSGIIEVKKYMCVHGFELATKFVREESK